MKAERIITRGVEEEPSVGAGEIPVLFFAVLGCLIFAGLLYLDRYAGGFNNEVYRPFDSYSRLMAVQPKDPEAALAAKGQALFAVACQICHQPNGLGTPGQFPPLDGSEWVNGPVNRLIRIPIIGLAGPITIKGEAWNAAMPNAGAAFNDEEIAALLTYIRRSWSNKSGAVKVEQVKAARAALGDHPQPLSSEELLALPPE